LFFKSFCLVFQVSYVLGIFAKRRFLLFGDAGGGGMRFAFHPTGAAGIGDAATRKSIFAEKALDAALFIN
jgi:hypothetical protein